MGPSRSVSQNRIWTPRMCRFSWFPFKPENWYRGKKKKLMWRLRISFYAETDTHAHPSVYAMDMKVCMYMYANVQVCKRLYVHMCSHVGMHVCVSECMSS